MPYNEADTRSKLIDPAIHARGWTEDLIMREVTAGGIIVVDGQPKKEPKGRADYTLRVKAHPTAHPVAVALIEAKAEHLAPAHGLEQAKVYATSKRLNVPFVFSSNGHLFVEFDRYTGLTVDPRPLTEFPNPQELRVRYEEAKGFTLDAPAAKPLLVPYPGGDTSRRYYQDAAIRAALEKMARGENRILLSLATGAGKTRIAVNLLKRIADAGQLRRALFVCDRDELRTQGLGAFRAVFGAEAAPVSGSNPQRNARILVATYQTLGVDTEDADAGFLTRNYPRDYFSHIIIDECHRSAWGKWSAVLTRNPGAIQVGLTATPRQIEVSEKTAEAQADAQVHADNLKHFGEPVYEYGMGQAIEDGYLAACDIIKRDIFLDHASQNEQATGVAQVVLEDKILRDANTGEAIALADTRERYEALGFEVKLLLPERVAAMCSDLFGELLATGGPEQKTVIFCAGDRHADAVANKLNNLYAAWCADNDHASADFFAFKCTAASGGGDYLPDLRGSARSHFIATTVDLLSTGVDVPALRNVVFFRYVKSPISFHQMVGRGTRLDPATGKLMFRVYDYTNATRLFSEDFVTRFATGKPREEGEPTEPEPVIEVAGFDVRVSPAGRFILTSDENGRAVPVTVEEYRERLAAKLVEEAPTLDTFRAQWINPRLRRELLARLPDGGRSAELVRRLADMDAFDLYDVLAELGYGMAPKTREERADAWGYKNATWLRACPDKTNAALRALVRQFARSGTDALESPTVLHTPEVKAAGGLAALQLMGKPPSELLSETKERVFTA